MQGTSRSYLILIGFFWLAFGGIVNAGDYSYPFKNKISKLNSQDIQNEIPLSEHSYFKSLEKQEGLDPRKWEMFSEPLEFILDTSDSESHKYIKTIGLQKEEKVKLSIIGMQEINWVELASINASYDHWARLFLSCYSNKSAIKVYIQHEFDKCPALKKELISLRERLIQFLVNTNIKNLNPKEYLSYEVKLPYVPEYLPLPLVKIKGELDARPSLVYFLSDFIADKSPKTGTTLNPFLVQSLFELTSGLLLPRFNLVDFGLDSFYTALPEFSHIAEGRFKNRGIAVWEPNTYRLHYMYSQILSGQESFMELDFHAMLEDLRYKKLQIHGALTNEMEYSNNSEDLRGIYSDFVSKAKPLDKYISKDLIGISNIAIRSLGLLTRLSFYVDPQSFGLTPEANAKLLQAYYMKGPYQESVIAELAKTLIANLQIHNAIENCECRRGRMLQESPQSEVYQRVFNYRYYLMENFPDLPQFRVRKYNR